MEGQEFGVASIVEVEAMQVVSGARALTQRQGRGRPARETDDIDGDASGGDYIDAAECEARRVHFSLH